MSSKHRIDAIKSILFMAVAALFLLHSDDAFAQASGALFDSGTNFLTALANLLTSTWARIIGIIAVACVGFMAMTGRMPAQVAITVAIGIILVFGAPAIVDSIHGSIG